MCVLPQLEGQRGKELGQPQADRQQGTKAPGPAVCKEQSTARPNHGSLGAWRPVLPQLVVQMSPSPGQGLTAAVQRTRPSWAQTPDPEKQPVNILSC